MIKTSIPYLFRAGLVVSKQQKSGHNISLAIHITIMYKENII